MIKHNMSHPLGSVRGMNPRAVLRRVQQGHLNNIRFRDLTRLVEALGFIHMRTSGSHHIYRHPGAAIKLNLQPLPSGEAKAYQVRQVRDLIEKYDLELEAEK